jgi:nicotinamide-nucleotide amidase
MWFDELDTIWVSMPGVPFEMKAIMETEVLPRLIKHFQLPVIVHQVMKTIGIGESYLSDLIQDWELQLPSHIKLAYLPSLGIVKLRLTGFGDSAEILHQQITAEYAKVMPLIKSYVFGYDKDELADVLGKLLITQEASLAVAESCTGGYLAHQFTQHAGSSAYFLGGVLAYANDVKMNQLGVSAQILEEEGAVSEACVISMANGARQITGSTYALATSGIAGPDGGTLEKPVGTIWIALAHPLGVIARKLTMGGTRVQNIHLTSLTAINLLRRYLLNDLAE